MPSQILRISANTMFWMTSVAECIHSVYWLIQYFTCAHLHSYTHTWSTAVDSDDSLKIISERRSNANHEKLKFAYRSKNEHEQNRLSWNHITVEYESFWTTIKFWNVLQKTQCIHSSVVTNAETAFSKKINKPFRFSRTNFIVN